MQWNGGGWAGAQLGGSCWMLVLGFVVVARDPGLAAIALGCFAGANAWGWWLWSRRDRIDPYPAVQALVVGLGVFGTAAALTLHARVQDGLEMPSFVYGVEYTPWIMLVFPLLMLQFWLQERAARARGRAASPGR